MRINSASAIDCTRPQSLRLPSISFHRHISSHLIDRLASRRSITFGVVRGPPYGDPGGGGLQGVHQGSTGVGRHQTRSLVLGRHIFYFLMNGNVGPTDRSGGPPPPPPPPPPPLFTPPSGGFHLEPAEIGSRPIWSIDSSSSSESSPDSNADWRRRAHRPLICLTPEAIRPGFYYKDRVSMARRWFFYLFIF